MSTYLCTKFSWSSPTCDTINWLSHGWALNQLSISQQTFTIKLIHEWLPIHLHHNKINRHHPIKCPVCNTHIESPEHFLSCNDTKYQPLFKKFLWNITKYCNTWECPTNLVQLLLLGLQHWPQPPIIPSKFPKEYQQVIQEQQQIGWKQLCYGRFTITWTERNKRKYQTQQRWAMAHGSHWHIWTYLHQQWTHCNNIANSNSSSTTPNKITILLSYWRDEREGWACLLIDCWSIFENIAAWQGGCWRGRIVCGGCTGWPSFTLGATARSKMFASRWRAWWSSSFKGWRGVAGVGLRSACMRSVAAWWRMSVKEVLGRGTLWGKNSRVSTTRVLRVDGT